VKICQICLEEVDDLDKHLEEHIKKVNEKIKEIT